MEKNKNLKLNKGVVLKSLSGIILVISIVFISAGKLIYWQGILYSALTVLVLLITFLSITNNPELINERLKPGKGIKSWDKIYWVLATSLFFITIILSALDSGRFEWSPDLPMYIYVIAVLIYITGYLIFAWARRANNFFSSVVRIQKDRGQTVCQDGLYRYIRHPEYLGGFLYTSVTPLLLGSLWGLIPTSITVVLMLVRTGLEDKTLEDELEGYKEYKAKVQYRLIPFVW